MESGAVVERAILADDVRVPAGLVLRDCAVVDAAGVAARGRERIERGLLIAPLT